MGDRVLELIIRAKDLTARTVGRFRRNWRAMERTIRDVTRAFVAFTAGATAAVLGLQKITERGEDVLAVKRAFARITGQETAALEELRRASAGTIDDYKLMALANQSLTLGASKNIEQFAEQVRLSRALGRAQGLEATQALEKFTLALARQSAQRADDLGLQLKGVEATRFHAEFMEQARRKAEDLTGGLDDTSSAAARFATGFKNARDRLAEWVATSEEVAQFFDFGHDLVAGITDAIVEMDFELLGDIFETLGETMADAWILGWNKAFQKMPERGGFSEWLEDNVPGLRALREWWEGVGPTQESFFGQGVDFARENLATDMTTLRELLGRARSGRGGSDGGPDPFTFDPSILAGITGPARFRPRFVPGGVTVPEPRGSVAAAMLGPGLNLPDVPEAADDFAQAGEIMVASMSSAAAAVIAGSENIEASLVRMISNVLRSLPGVGGFAGALIGGVGGIFGALLSRRRDPVPVRMADIDNRAADKLRDSSREPLNITSIIQLPDGTVLSIEQVELELAERQRRNATVRYGQSGRAFRTRGAG